MLRNYDNDNFSYSGEILFRVINKHENKVLFSFGSGLSLAFVFKQAPTKDSYFTSELKTLGTFVEDLYTSKDKIKWLTNTEKVTLLPVSNKGKTE